MKGLALCLLLSLGLHAEVTQEFRVIDSGGGSSSSAGGLKLLQSIGQGISTPSQIAGTPNREHHQGGVLAKVVQQPKLDTDEDGLVDELDSDNDNDGVEDHRETDGSAYTPSTVTNLNNADSDGDGASDGEEAEAGFNPMDASRFFGFDQVELVNGKLSLHWQARAGRSYGLYRFDLLDPENSKVLIHTAEPLIGMGAWLETAVTHEISPPASGAQFFKVEEL